jgi:hypothetical protein
MLTSDDNKKTGNLAQVYLETARKAEARFYLFI